MKFAIDGVACCFKSSALRCLGKNGVKTSLTDLTENLEKYPLLKNLIQSKDDQVYGIFMAMARCEENVIYDRTPIANILYRYVFNDKLYIEPYKLIETLMAIKNLNMMMNWKIMVVLPREDQFEEVVNRMINRNNGIDLLTVDYVIRQTNVFRIAANILEWVIVEVDHTDPIKSIQNIQNAAQLLFLDQPLTSTAITLKNHVFDAGWDLTLKEQVQCLAGIPTKLIFAEIIVIPTDFYGLLASRSSTNELGNLRWGVVDANYSGFLTTIFIADKDQRFKQGTRLAQLVLMPVLLKQPLFVPHIPLIGRGTAGVGSSNCLQKAEKKELE